MTNTLRRLGLLCALTLVAATCALRADEKKIGQEYPPLALPGGASPSGGINRARQKIYLDSSRVRHSTNKAPLQEPTGKERFD